MSRKIKTAPAIWPCRFLIGGGTVLNQSFGAILSNEQGVVRKPENQAFPQSSCRWILSGLTGFFVDDLVNRGEGTADSLLRCPAGQCLGHGVHEGDVSTHVRGNHRIAN